MKRDYQADLEACEKATKGPWTAHEYAHRWYIYNKNIGGKEVADDIDEQDAQFIALSREAIPYYIKRCIDLEKQCILHKSDINSLKIALELIDDQCVRFHENGPYSEKGVLRRMMRIRDIAVTALAALEGGDSNA